MELRQYHQQEKEQSVPKDQWFLSPVKNGPGWDVTFRSLLERGRVGVCTSSQWMFLSHNRMLNFVYNKVGTEGKWNGGGENEMPFSASPPATNGRIHRGLGMNSCYYHYYEGQRLTRFASGAFTNITAIPDTTALFQAVIISLQGQNFSRYVWIGWQVYWDPEPLSFQIGYLWPRAASSVYSSMPYKSWYFLWYGKGEDTLTSGPPIATWLSSLPPVSTHFSPLCFLLSESRSKIRLSLSLKILNSSSPKNHCFQMSHKALHDLDSIYSSKHICH